MNLTLSGEVLVPAYGVYVSQVKLEDGRRFPACTNIGVRPTVEDGGGVTVESFLLDFNGDLYGQRLRLALYHRLRGERAFPSLEALKDEVAKNIGETRRYFSSAEP